MTLTLVHIADLILALPKFINVKQVVCENIVWSDVLWRQPVSVAKPTWGIEMENCTLGIDKGADVGDCLTVRCLPVTCESI